MNVRRKKKPKKMLWLGPESNRQCLHSSLEHHKWKADADYPLPSLPILLYTSIIPQDFRANEKERGKNSANNEHGSGLSRTGNVCINIGQDVKHIGQMRTLRYRALSTCLCTLP
jgi:hypothetical protein